MLLSNCGFRSDNYYLMYISQRNDTQMYFQSLHSIWCLLASHKENVLKVECVQISAPFRWIYKPPSPMPPTCGANYERKVYGSITLFVDLAAPQTNKTKQNQNKHILITCVSLASDPLFVKKTFSISVAVNISRTSFARSCVVWEETNEVRMEHRSMKYNINQISLTVPKWVLQSDSRTSDKTATYLAAQLQQQQDEVHFPLQVFRST